MTYLLCQHSQSCLCYLFHVYFPFLHLSSSCCLFILGEIKVSGGMKLYFDLDGENFQFTLTCVSTGGPATTVTWTRDSVTVTNGTETVLDNRTTSQYTHTLTVTGRQGGLYTCTVANNKPSTDSANCNVQGDSTTVDSCASVLLNLYIHIACTYLEQLCL